MICMYSMPVCAHMQACVERWISAWEPVRSDNDTNQSNKKLEVSLQNLLLNVLVVSAFPVWGLGSFLFLLLGFQSGWG